MDDINPSYLVLIPFTLVAIGLLYAEVKLLTWLNRRDTYRREAKRRMNDH